jgi:2'-hydroxyisoflavone reductase
MEKLLLFGGTNFIGRNLLNDLIRLNKFEITIFNRGKTNPNLFTNIKKIIGDRETDDINLIKDKKFDYIIDMSCYYPNSFEKLLNIIDYKPKKYIFISTCSVYDTELNNNALHDESSAVLGCTIEERTADIMLTYGNKKAECERILINSDLPYIIFRPGLVYGEFDHTDRFYYWLYQVKNNENILMPNMGENVFSLTYVKDFSKGIIKSINSNKNSDIYNFTTFPQFPIKKIIELGSKLFKTKPNLHNTSSEYLEDNKINQWTDLPLWLDNDDLTFNSNRAIEDFNLEFTNFETSIKETIKYYDEINWPKPKAGISDERKMELIRGL